MGQHPVSLPPQALRVPTAMKDGNAFFLRLPERSCPSQFVWIYYNRLLGPSPGLGGLDAGRGLAHLLV